jgi:hypothetical protein
MLAAKRGATQLSHVSALMIFFSHEAVLHFDPLSYVLYQNIGAKDCVNQEHNGLP